MKIMDVYQSADTSLVTSITARFDINLAAIEKTMCSFCITRDVIATGNKNPTLAP